MYRTKRQVSAGAVIVRRDQAEAQVCLIARHGSDGLIWGLPKGHVEEGEDPQATAIREVREETGLVGEALAKLGSISYWFAVKQEGVRYFKTVHFYLLRYVGGDTQAHDREVEDAAWFPVDEAIARISYDNERRILLKAKHYLHKGQLRVES